MEDMAFDDKECDDCMSCVDDDCCDKVSCDGSSVHDNVGVCDDEDKVDHIVFEADDNNSLRRRRQDDDDGGCSVDSDDDDCVDDALSFP